MKILRDMTAALLVILLSLIIVPQDVMARGTYTYHVSSLKQNKWINTKGTRQTIDSKVWYVYKISVPAKGYVKLETNSTDSLGIITTLDETINLQYYNKGYTFSGDTTYSKVVQRGINYIYTKEDMSIRWSFIKVSDPGNYCMKKAKRLPSGKKETIVIADGYEYDRWYRINLTKAKIVRINVDSLIECDIFDSKYRRFYSNNKLPKGTYFIKVSSPDTDNFTGYDALRIFSLSWK